MMVRTMTEPLPYPPDMIIECADDQMMVTCLSCDGLHHIIPSGMDVEDLNVIIAAHVTVHLHMAIQHHVPHWNPS